MNVLPVFLVFSQLVIFGYTFEYEYQWLTGCASPVTDWQPVPGGAFLFPCDSWIGSQAILSYIQKVEKMDGFGIPDSSQVL